jgi:putative membrane protein insertion efficiency factor
VIDAVWHGVRWAIAFVLKLPVRVYRLTFKGLVGWHCRHLPTCSEYALEAIDRNGPWRGFWLMISRLSRCRPGGSAGYDPVPDISGERHPFAPWRHGRWTGRHIAPPQAGPRPGES